MKARRSRIRQRGQVWSLDFVTSIVVFLVILMPLFFVWSYINAQSTQQIEFNSIESAALQISDSLVRTQGIPGNWNISNVRVIGLVSDENILNSTKVSSFLSMGNSDYERTKSLLTGNYDFYFSLTDINGTSLGTIGNKSEKGNVVPVERYCLYNGRIVKLQLVLMS